MEECGMLVKFSTVKLKKENQEAVSDVDGKK
jgi:hypothetical protein